MSFARKVRGASAPQQLPPVVPPDPEPDPGYAWATLGPNAPAGLDSPFADFLGDTLPAAADTFGSIVPNAYGMAGTHDQLRHTEIVSDPTYGSALRLHYPGSGNPRGICQFPPTDAIGGAPGSFFLRHGLYDNGVPRKWTKLYIHLWYRFSPNWSLAARQQALTTHYTGTFTSGSTTTVANDTAKSWTTNELMGKCVQIGNNKGAIVVSNTATSLTVSTKDRFNFNPTGSTYRIITFAPTAVTGVSAGSKGFFWPLQMARMVGPVAGVGDGAALGTWNAPKDFVGRWPENHYHGCWQNFVGGGGGAPGGIWDAFALQLNKRWDPPYVENASDLPVWSGNRFTQYPPPAPLPYTRGDVMKAQYFLQMNTPGVANGIWRVHHNGVLMRDIQNVMYCERFVSAQDVEGVSGQARPVIGGSPRDVAYEIAECYWGSMWHSMTGGGAPVGGNFLFDQDQYADVVRLAVSGS